MANWKVGDVVTLKGGGPVMTVTSLDNNNGKPYCHWFVSGKPEGASFPAEALKESTPE